MDTYNSGPQRYRMRDITIDTPPAGVIVANKPLRYTKLDRKPKVDYLAVIGSQLKKLSLDMMRDMLDAPFWFRLGERTEAEKVAATTWVDRSANLDFSRHVELTSIASGFEEDDHYEDGDEF